MKKPHTRNETIEIEPPIGPDQIDETPTTGRVAQGRTIETPTGEQAFRCLNARGEPVYRPVLKRHGPGEIVTLPKFEIERLQQLGFLEDETKIVRDEREAAQLCGAQVVDLENRGAADERARADGRSSSTRVR